MLGAVEHMKVRELLRAEFGLGEHAFHNFDEQRVFALHCHLERLVHEILRSVAALTAGITGVAEILALAHLVTVEDDLVCVDDDHIVTAVDVGSLVCLVLATENLCDIAAKAAENLVGSIDNHPFLLDCSRGGRECLVT